MTWRLFCGATASRSQAKKGHRVWFLPRHRVAAHQNVEKGGEIGSLQKSRKSLGLVCNARERAAATQRISLRARERLRSRAGLLGVVTLEDRQGALEERLVRGVGKRAAHERGDALADEGGDNLRLRAGKSSSASIRLAAAARSGAV